jgi:hypothetical protein
MERKVGSPTSNGVWAVHLINLAGWAGVGDGDGDGDGEGDGDGAGDGAGDGDGAGAGDGDGDGDGAGAGAAQAASSPMLTSNVTAINRIFFLNLLPPRKFSNLLQLLIESDHPLTNYSGKI